MKKTHRLAALALAVVIGISALPIVASAAAKGKINATNVNLRKTASTKAASLGKLNKGTEVELVSQTGDWYKITAGGKTGYVMKTYVTRTTTTGSTTTNTTASKATYVVTLKQNATIYKTAKASASNKLSTGKKGAKYDVVSQTATFYKIKVGSSVGYVQKTFCTLSKSTGSTTTTTPAVRPGDEVGYTSSTISKPSSDTQTSRAEVLNAMNWNLLQMNTNFTIKIKNYKYSMLPQKMSDLERYFVDRIEPSSEEPKDLGNNISEITYNVTYNDAGKVVLDLLKGNSIASTETKALAIKTEAQKILKAIEGKSDYEKIVYIHDYIVANCTYDEAKSDDSRTPYGVLVKGIGSCQGYAETTQMLFTLAGLENRFVWANVADSSDPSGTHGFNKVKLDGKWYVVDATVDDPISKKAILTGRVKHDYLLVTDSVARQRYNWEAKRYPACSTDNNWHKRNNLVATSQAQLETLVKAGVKKKQQFVSVWVNDYSKSKYSTAFANKLGATLYNVTTTPASAPGYAGKAYKTALFFEFKY